MDADMATGRDRRLAEGSVRAMSPSATSPVSRSATAIRLLSGLVALFLLVLTALPTPAASNGNGGGKAGPAVSITGDAVVGHEVSILGEGFKRRAPIFIVPSDNSPSILVESDRNGSFSTVWTVTSVDVSSLTFYALMKKNDWDRVLVVPLKVSG